MFGRSLEETIQVEGRLGGSFVPVLVHRCVKFIRDHGEYPGDVASYLWAAEGCSQGSPGCLSANVKLVTVWLCTIDVACCHGLSNMVALSVLAAVWIVLSSWTELCQSEVDSSIGFSWGYLWIEQHHIYIHVHVHALHSLVWPQCGVLVYWCVGVWQTVPLTGDIVHHSIFGVSYVCHLNAGMLEFNL